MAKAIHSMIRVLDLDRSIDFYTRAFDLKIAERIAFDSFTLVYLSNAEAAFEVELTLNHGRTQPYDLGDGYGHIAFSTDDLDGLRARHQAAGFAPKDIKELRRDGKLVGRFFFVDDPDGYKIEVLEQSGRFK